MACLGYVEKGNLIIDLLSQGILNHDQGYQFFYQLSNSIYYYHLTTQRWCILGKPYITLDEILSLEKDEKILNLILFHLDDLKKL